MSQNSYEKIANSVEFKATSLRLTESAIAYLITDIELSFPI